jgi:hypothetical protein
MDYSLTALLTTLFPKERRHAQSHSVTQFTNSPSPLFSVSAVFVPALVAYKKYLSIRPDYAAHYDSIVNQVIENLQKPSVKE